MTINGGHPPVESYERDDMKKGISIWAFPEDWALARSFALAAEAGFDGIEMAYAADGPIHPQVTASELADLRNAAHNAGLEISSLASGIFWSVNLISDNTQEREAAKQHLAANPEVVAKLTAEIMEKVQVSGGTALAASNASNEE